MCRAGSGEIWARSHYLSHWVSGPGRGLPIRTIDTGVVALDEAALAAGAAGYGPSAAMGMTSIPSERRVA